MEYKISDRVRDAEDSTGRLALAARPASLTGVVLEAIRTAITDATLPPGGRITEAGLAAELDVSKTPVREALLKLRQVGLVEDDGRRGWRVVQPSLERISHAYELREALEVFASRRACETVAAQHAVAIRDAADRSHEGAVAGDASEFRHWDSVFHLSVAEATANPRLLESIADVHSLIVTLRQRDLPHISFHVECALAHVRIAAAIADRDVFRAENETRAHVHQVRDYVVANFQATSRSTNAVSAR
jgi:DNA-binding GntR family transcriptional regulator